MDEEFIEEYKQTPLEYRPNLQREDKERVGWEQEASIEEDYRVPDDEESIGDGLVTGVIGDYKETEGILQSEVEKLESKLRRETIDYSEEYKEYVIEAKKELGLEGEGIGILDYKEALLKSNTPAGAFLLDIIELNIEDVEGSLEWEVYGEYIEAQIEMSLMNKYIEKLIHPFIDYVEPEENWEEEMRIKEYEWGEKREKIEENKDSKEIEYRKALLFNPGLIPQTRGFLHNAEKTYDEIIHEHEHLYNSLQTVLVKTRDVNYLIEFGTGIVEQELEEDILEDLFLLADNEKEEDERMINIQKMLQLSVDKKIQEKSQVKNTLRNTYSITKQEKQLDELVVYENSYIEETLPLLHHVRGLQKRPGDQTDAFLNQVAIGMEENQNKRDEKLYEMFLLNQATASLREKKLNIIFNKEDSRKSFQSIKQEQIERQKNA